MSAKRTDSFEKLDARQERLADTIRELRRVADLHTAKADLEAAEAKRRAAKGPARLVAVVWPAV